jgi:hypothetical protein
MAKKKFEEVEYDPIAAEAKRQLARTVSSPSIVSKIVPMPQELPTIKVDPIQLREPIEIKPIEPELKATPESREVYSRGEPLQPIQRAPEINNVRQRKEKKRSFSCASVEQDSELDSFIQRMQEAAGTYIPFQVLMRAACTAMLSAEDQIIGEMKKTQPPTFPAKYAHAKYAEFEEYWIQVVQKAIRKSRTFTS